MNILFLFCTGFLLSCASNSDHIRFQSAPFDDKAPIISGHVYKPRGEGPFPAVIVLHACAGLDDHAHQWAKQLNEWGYVAFPIDSFGPRGVSNVCTNTGRVTGMERALDAIGAVQSLWQLSFVQTEKIGIIGFSHGGIAALEATKENLSRYVAKLDSIPFKAVVAYYPKCDSGYSIAVPTMILIGEKDDWTPADNCRSLDTFEMIQVNTFENAHHGFDRLGSFRTYGGHTLVYDAAATAKSKQLTKEFFDRYLKSQ